ncbi:MAG: hypothetical protein ACTSO9_06520 [Candidatus Helarchaeota archaeon]
MKCPKCGNDSLIFGAFSAADKLRAACLECYIFWEIDSKKIVIKNLKLEDKRK